MRQFKQVLVYLPILLTVLGNGFTRAADQEANPTPLPTAQGADEMLNESLEMEIGLNIYAERWTGDLDEMVKQRMVRVLTTYGLGRYYLDGGRERGLTYDFFKAFENHLNERLGRKHVRVHVVFIPVSRDELLTGVMQGRGDIAAAQLVITPEYQALVDFTDPLTREVSEILVTGPSAPRLTSIDDLAGQVVYVRKSSTYHASLEKLNSRFLDEGKSAIDVQPISEYLEDVDIIEMVNSGLLPWAVVDDYKARAVSGVFDDTVMRDDIVFRKGGRIGVAVRKGSPQLLAELNEFSKTHRQGTLHGNMLINRYVKDYKSIKNALGTEDLERFKRVAHLFEKYGEQYGIDYLLVTAQGYQESGLNQDAKSRVGAIGIMQLLPTTAADRNVGIEDISDAESNIHAGVKYLNFLRSYYFDDPQIDRFNQTLLAMAAYNAGPGRVKGLRAKAEKQGYDPNIWFDNVEIIAAQEIGRETVQYVANILKYYVGYRLSVQQKLKRVEDIEKLKANQE